MNGQSDWPKSHLCPKFPVLIGQMRFRDLTSQDVGLLYYDWFFFIQMFFTLMIVQIYNAGLVSLFA
jgi:hypothetical protein